MQKYRTVFWILGSILVLAFLLFGFMALRHRTTPENPALAIVHGGQTYPINTDKLPDPVTMTGKDGKPRTGQTILALLASCQIDTTMCSRIVFNTSDGGSVSIKPGEAKDALLVMEAPNEWRLVIPTDEFKQRWLKKINRIIVE
jgi:hypothetical protein